MMHRADEALKNLHLDEEGPSKSQNDEAITIIVIGMSASEMALPRKRSFSRSSCETKTDR